MCFFLILERPIFRADTRSKAVGDAWNSEAKDLGLGPRGVEELGGNSPRVMGVCLKNMTKRWCELMITDSILILDLTAFPISIAWLLRVPSTEMLTDGFGGPFLDTGDRCCRIAGYSARQGVNFRG